MFQNSTKFCILCDSHQQVAGLASSQQIDEYRPFDVYKTSESTHALEVLWTSGALFCHGTSKHPINYLNLHLICIYKVSVKSKTYTWPLILIQTLMLRLYTTSLSWTRAISALSFSSFRFCDSIKLARSSAIINNWFLGQQQLSKDVTGTNVRQKGSSGAHKFNYQFPTSFHLLKRNFPTK